jgi:wyosine [tRNA(Phe)-imidazoG37] synthetase (radical SAM superfamily)
MIDGTSKTDTAALFKQHTRHWRENYYVYPVISRRSQGLSIGVNLNPDKACNFDCVYCQVDRTVAPVVRKVEMGRLREELEAMVQLAVSGALFEDVRFGSVPEHLRRINDIAFSGDGEPTTSPQFPEAVDLAAELKRRYGLDDVKIVLITDAAYLTKPRVREALGVMDAHNGEIWAKLDAGTEEYYQLVNRPNVPLATVLQNILETARVRPIVIQSLWMNVRDESPPPEEVDAFARRLRGIVEQGGRIKLVQVYTIARETTEPWVTPLRVDQLEAIADRIRRIVDVPLAVFGGTA